MLCVGVCIGTALLSGCSASIHDMVAHGSAPEVGAFLDQHPDAVHARDGKQKTPLHIAVTYKKLAAMELLVSRGANVNAADVTGMTPLHVAAMLGRKEEAAWLLDHGADPMAQDQYADTPLHTAAVFGSGQIISLYRERGLDIAASNGKGESARDIAYRYRHEKVVQYLDRVMKTM